MCCILQYESDFNNPNLTAAVWLGMPSAMPWMWVAIDMGSDEGWLNAHDKSISKRFRMARLNVPAGSFTSVVLPILCNGAHSAKNNGFHFDLACNRTLASFVSLPHVQGESKSTRAISKKWGEIQYRMRTPQVLHVGSDAVRLLMPPSQTGQGNV